MSESYSKAFDIIKEMLNDFKDFLKENLKDRVKLEALKSVEYNTERRFRLPEENEVILVTSEYCPECNELKEHYNILKAYARANEMKFTVIELNDADEIDKAIAEGVDEVPVLLIRKDGKLVKQYPIDVIREYVRLLRYMKYGV